MLTVEQKKHEDGTLSVTLRGKIDADFDGSAIVRAATGRRVAIALAEVDAISSLGVFALTRFIEALKGRDREIVFLHVSAVLARQLAILPGLFAAVQVESARLPFLCGRCGAEDTASIPFRAGADVTHAPRCSCGATMELDGIAEQYLPS